MEELSPSIVIDYGSNSIKYGLTGDEEPHLLNGYAIEDSAADPSSFLDDFEVNFERMLTELKVEPGKYPVLLTRVPHRKPQTEQTAQVLFEKFNQPAISIQAPGVLALFSSGRLSGLVLDSGHSFTYTVPVSDGKIIKPGVDCVEFGGRELNGILSSMVVGVDNLKDMKNYEIVNDIKEKSCYVAFDYSKELVSAVEKKSFNITHKLPDGQEVVVGTERFRCPEAIFSPKLFDLEMNGVEKLIFNSISACDSALHRKLFSNIMLSGGTTTIEGFTERIRKDLSAMDGIPIGMKIISPQEKIFSAWIGGTLVAAQSSFPQVCVTKEEFEEFGSEILREKFSIQKES